MKSQDPKLIVQAAPFLQQGLTTPQAMLDVIYVLIPITLLSVYFFGIGVLLILIATILGAVLTEWIFSEKHALLDGSAILTGLLLGLTLPPNLPLWMAFVGSVVGVGLGKTIWGGLGNNLFNPALVGRAFLLANFPVAMTTWVAQTDSLFTISASNLAMPFMQSPDAISTATPLGMMKFEQQATPLLNLMFGNSSGSFGETCGLLIILAGLYLILRRSIDWRIPVAILGSVAIFTGILFIYNSDIYPSPLFTIFSGGLLFGCFFMATDPVTSPLTPKGAWIFGIGIGIIVVLIRVFGGFPEGVMYAILLMNATVPLIERYTQPRAFGHKS
ncbi:RnfABCDGE type electron transport complex subunit D [Candidatus Halobeggiatoa sp. HSG11]|nr:RnfABCDGE type electron transport complex subunit D [Candidatus Halobeggiatoa sp. HSG11]